MSRAIGLLIVVVALAGCAHQPPAVVTPSVVTQTVTRYVAVPDELTTPCPVALPTNRTVAEAVRVARARRDALDQCNRQLDAIRSLQPEAKQ